MFIGAELDQRAIEERLEAALVTTADASSLQGGGDLIVDAEFEPAVGGITQADFVWDAGLRYTILSLHVTGAPESAAANSLGVTIGYFYRFES